MNLPATRRDWFFALMIAILVVAAMQIPYVLGYGMEQPGKQFTGLIMNPEDSQSYFAKMLEGYDGHWLYTIPFTTEEHAPAFVGGFYLLLGHLARALGLSLTAIWHLARLVAALTMFLVVFGFIATFLREPRARWVAYLLAVFGSGLGWLLFLLNQPYWLDTFPVDFKMPEAHLFFTALTFPHVALGTAFILTSLWLSFNAIAARRLSYALGAGIANLGLAIVYPFLIYLIGVILVLYWFYLTILTRRVLWRESLLLGISLLPPAPLVIYYALTLTTNPIFRAWDAQSITLSPPAPHYLVAYGLMLLLAVPTLRRDAREYAFLWSWLLAVALLVYAPLNPQRRFVEGVHVPLAILATAGLCGTVLPCIERTKVFQWIVSHPRYSTKGLERLLLIAFLFFMSLSNLYILTSVTVTATLQQPYPLFRARDEIGAVDWLRTHTARADVVLSDYETGNYIGAHAGNHVVIGHWAETVDWARKLDEVKQFYSRQIDDVWSRELLVRYHVAYIWWGASERALGNFDPERAPYLERVFANGQSQIYRVRVP